MFHLELIKTVKIFSQDSLKLLRAQGEKFVETLATLMVKLKWRRQPGTSQILYQFPEKAV